MPEESYVSNRGWRRPAGRAEAIDDVADQFERPDTAGATAFWTAEAELRWPRSPRGWRSLERMHPRAVERRAG